MDIINNTEVTTKSKITSSFDILQEFYKDCQIIGMTGTIVLYDNNINNYNFKVIEKTFNRDIDTGNYIGV